MFLQSNHCIFVKRVRSCVFKHKPRAKSKQHCVAGRAKWEAWERQKGKDKASPPLPFNPVSCKPVLPCVA